MNNQGWVKLHRKILENPISRKPNYLAVWIYILSHANHSETEIIWNNEKVKIPIGAFIGSISKISEHFNLSTGTVSNICKYLISEKMIEKRSTMKFSFFRVINWYDYQEEVEKRIENKLKPNRKQVETNKNEKNVKNISKDIGAETPEEFGSKDINFFFKKINSFLEVKLPEDKKARFIVSNMLKLLSKSKSRDWMDDDKWKNAKKWFEQYDEYTLQKGFYPHSWYKVYDNLKLWIANKGDLSKLNKD